MNCAEAHELSLGHELAVAMNCAIAHELVRAT
jgi:hypothetical protein